MSEPETDLNRRDEAILALPSLTLRQTDRVIGLATARETVELNAINGLWEKTLIFNTLDRAKSAVLTKEGFKRSEALFYGLFSNATLLA